MLLMAKKVTLDKNSVIIAVKPFGDEKFICGVDKNYKADTQQKEICYAVALGLCQIALDDPDMVYDIGLSVMRIEELKNGKAEVIDIKDWRKKLN